MLCQILSIITDVDIQTGDKVRIARIVTESEYTFEAVITEAAAEQILTGGLGAPPVELPKKPKPVEAPRHAPAAEEENMFSMPEPAAEAPKPRVASAQQRHTVTTPPATPTYDEFGTEQG